jgi:molybdate/tungstate transport system substrate-binding protein
MKLWCLMIVWVTVGLLVCVATHGVASTDNQLVIYHAGSLSQPFEKMEKAFEASFPDINIVRKSGGSTELAQQIAGDPAPADIMVSADYTVIDKILIPEYADWNICFATNQMVLCYTGKSRYAAQINPNNWYEVLARKEVGWGHSDPNLDPCGYRSLMVLQLAEMHYNKKGLYETLIANRPTENIRPQAAELVTLLKAGKMDYAWEYLSVAVQHGLNYVPLPDEINLGNSAHDPFYSRATVQIAGKDNGAKIEKKGSSCTYGVTMLKNSKHQKAAEAFLAYLLNPNGGLNLLAEMGQPPIVPCRLSSEEMAPLLPDKLSEWVKQDGRGTSGTPALK